MSHLKLVWCVTRERFPSFTGKWRSSQPVYPPTYLHMYHRTLPYLLTNLSTYPPTAIEQLLKS